MIAQLVGDAKVALEIAKQAYRGHSQDAEATSDVRAAIELLQGLLLQDIDETPADGGPPEIRRGTKPDRIVSTTEFQQTYRRRVAVEHRIARLVQIGMRRARYLSRVKVAFQVAMAAAVANLLTAMTAT